MTELPDGQGDEREKRHIERVDLTGNRVPHWTTRARSWLAAKLAPVVEASTDDDSTLKEKAKSTTRAAVNSIEDNLRKQGVENELKSAQTKTEFLNQELLRERIRNTREETRAKQLDNAARELEILARLQALTETRGGVRITEIDDRLIAIVGDIKGLPSPTGDDADSPEEEIPVKPKSDRPPEQNSAG